jgi:iron-sulfur cluster assembly protein
MQQQTTGPINKDMMIGDVVQKYPQVADVFLSYGLHCVGCHVNAYETIEQGAMGHGMTPEEVEEMVAEANTYITDSENPKQEFTATTRAISKLKELAAEENKNSWGLRVEVQAGGCSGFRYNLEFEEKTKENDIVIDPGFKLYVDPESNQMLMGATLDYVEGLNGSGFKVNNPNAKSHCGCGKSFH